MKWIVYIDIPTSSGVPYAPGNLYLCYGRKAHSVLSSRQEVEDFIQEYGWGQKCQASRCWNKHSRMAWEKGKHLYGGLWGMEK